MISGYVTPEVAREIFGDRRAVLAWGPSPDARAVPVDAERRPGTKLDLAGAALCALGLAGITFGLVEQPQSFNTFGGWGAGNLVDAVTTTAGSALIGSWGSDKAGLDAAAWLPSGAKWIRQSSAGTALGRG